MGQLRFEAVGSVRLALAEATRTDDSSADRVANRYIELRPGMTEKLGARRHHLLTGRRGTGKSTLLHVVRKRLVDGGIAVASVDMERFKGREFPDVLIEILISLLKEIRPPRRARDLILDWSFRGKVGQLAWELTQSLSNPQSVRLRVDRKAKSEKRAWLQLGAENKSNPLRGSAVISGGRLSQSTTSSEAEFEVLKMDILQQLAPKIADILSELVKRSPEQRAIVFIDDYYFVGLEDQPRVLDYLHQVCKGTGVWLKIGGVKSRLNPYAEGNPPKGMQLGQDMDLLELDITLDAFATAKHFLEKMLDGVLGDLHVTANSLFSETAGNRMVLACGGAVARDCITLTDAALDETLERMGKKNTYKAGALVSISSEDVQRAALKRLNSKEDDELSIDAGSDAPAVKARWRDICDFTSQSAGGNAFVLVKLSDLDGTTWGKEIQQLESMRLLHRIKDTVPNTPKWRGIKTMVFMVDLAQVAGQRLRTAIPEFWSGTAEFDRLRRAEWVYSPDWRANHVKKSQI